MKNSEEVKFIKYYYIQIYVYMHKKQQTSPKLSMLRTGNVAECSSEFL